MQAKQNLKVLIVDANLKTQEKLKAYFEKKKCEVHCVKNKSEALPHLFQKVYHMAFVDYILSDAQGIDLVKEVKKIVGNSVSFIMMSGIVPESTLSRFIKSNYFDFLSKPISEKTLDQFLEKTKDRIFQKTKNTVLENLYSKSSTEIEVLKYLVQSHKLSGSEFLLFLNSLMLSKNLMKATVKCKGETFKLTFNHGNCIHFEQESPEKLLNYLKAQGSIDENTKNVLSSMSVSDCMEQLISRCIVSSGSLEEANFELFLKFLKEACLEQSLDFQAEMINEKPNHPFSIYTNKELSDFLLRFSHPVFQKNVKSLFTSEIIKKNLIFNNQAPHYPEAIQEMASNFQTGMKINGMILNSKNESLLYSQILYILFQGSVKLSEDVKKTGVHIKERFSGLSKFADSVKNPEEFFAYIDGRERNIKISNIEVTSIYKRFVKDNHPDTLPSGLPEDVFKLVNATMVKVHHLYQRITDVKIKAEEVKQKRDEEIQKQLLITEQKKICEQLLEAKDYEKAAKLIKKIPREVIEGQINWLLFYVWIGTHRPDLVDVQRSKKYSSYMQANSDKFKREYSYYYVLAKKWHNNGDYKKAKHYYTQAKALHPSFQPIHEALKEISLRELGTSTKKKGFLDQLSDMLNNTGKKKIPKKKAS